MVVFRNRPTVIINTTGDIVEAYANGLLARGCRNRGSDSLAASYRDDGQQGSREEQQGPRPEFAPPPPRTPAQARRLIEPEEPQGA